MAEFLTRIPVSLALFALACLYPPVLLRAYRVTFVNPSTRLTGNNRSSIPGSFHRNEVAGIDLVPWGIICSINFVRFVGTTLPAVERSKFRQHRHYLYLDHHPVHSTSLGPPFRSSPTTVCPIFPRAEVGVLRSVGRSHIQLKLTTSSRPPDS